LGAWGLASSRIDGDYPTMFTVVAGFILLWPLSGYFLTEKAVERTRERDGPTKGETGLGKSYYYLFAACLIASVAGFVVLMGRSILMEDLEFKAFDVSVTGAVSGLVSMPLPSLIGWLSDRMDRKRFLYLGYLVGVISLAILTVSADLWHFVVVLALQAIFLGAYTTIGNALVTDLLPQESLGRGLALFGTTTWIGGILGFSGTGYALKAIGATPTFILGMCLPLIAMAILIPVRSRREVS
jgi:MFS family permease